MNQEVIIVRGNHTLKGDVRVSGAKNSALKLMAASILGQGETILHNVPLISDIEHYERGARASGCHRGARGAYARA